MQSGQPSSRLEQMDQAVRKAEEISLQPAPAGVPAEELVRTMRLWMAQWPRRSLSGLLRSWLREAEHKCLRLDPAAEGTRLAREQGKAEILKRMLDEAKFVEELAKHMASGAGR